MMEIEVMLTAAFREAYLELVPAFERATGNKVASVWVSSVDMMTHLEAGEVARGEAELGFQQMSELLPVSGIDIVGPLPPDIQEITTFAAALHNRAEHPDAAKALVTHFRAAEAAPVIRRKGMEPA